MSDRLLTQALDFLTELARAIFRRHGRPAKTIATATRPLRESFEWAEVSKDRGGFDVMSASQIPVSVSRLHSVKWGPIYGSRIPAWVGWYRLADNERWRWWVAANRMFYLDDEAVRQLPPRMVEEAAEGMMART